MNRKATSWVFEFIKRIPSLLPFLQDSDGESSHFPNTGMALTSDVSKRKLFSLLKSNFGMTSDTGWEVLRGFTFFCPDLSVK